MAVSGTSLPAIQPGREPVALYLEQIRSFPMLEPKEEYMLAKAWKERGDVDAAHRLVTSHLRLVAKIAMGYRGYGLPVADLISEGNLGMMHAVKKFGAGKGVSACPLMRSGGSRRQSRNISCAHGRWCDRHDRRPEEAVLQSAPHQGPDPGHR